MLTSPRSGWLGVPLLSAAGRTTGHLELVPLISPLPPKRPRPVWDNPLVRQLYLAVVALKKFDLWSRQHLQALGGASRVSWPSLQTLLHSTHLRAGRLELADLSHLLHP